MRSLETLDMYLQRLELALMPIICEDVGEGSGDRLVHLLQSAMSSLMAAIEFINDDNESIDKAMIEQVTDLERGLSAVLENMQVRSGRPSFDAILTQRATSIDVRDLSDAAEQLSRQIEDIYQYSNSFLSALPTGLPRRPSRSISDIADAA
ncbi:Uncharacterized protein PBTT_04478 [Plasmodiophora brassicae]|uniref:Uncharacterized protein n=1 Tax=Plasmodiophora brassicae TaxID=37360 RepID=A0A0G4J7F7_PLABS|nr:hypothetical protein PBRA_009405 [Plasmodiophora brassicae]SPQ96532.1 unnamed protein product [Plasmodiophora brassicae]